ncbi:hypothetical protein Cyrtocomes_01104 [Candidatus Cyrtobacter comes]|uniref:Uncharacterized protein n=1 Tax=Candidatus Cyrtobacter comes TaxID=675776 RepID=A0ABU5L9J1_9RICK|nr:hypothetical protein [Candidatus Cyrtobacter comes]
MPIVSAIESAWKNKALSSTLLFPITKSPKPLSYFPSELHNHIKETALPTYIEGLREIANLYSPLNKLEWLFRSFKGACTLMPIPFYIMFAIKSNEAGALERGGANSILDEIRAQNLEHTLCFEQIDNLLMYDSNLPDYYCN